jgi:phosphoadenosine phosphosulfate reductase
MSRSSPPSEPNAAVLLHMAADLDRDLPVLLVDTLMLFPETLDYQRSLARHLGLTNVQHLRADAADLARLDSTARCTAATPTPAA